MRVQRSGCRITRQRAVGNQHVKTGRNSEWPLCRVVRLLSRASGDDAAVVMQRVRSHVSRRERKSPMQDGSLRFDGEWMIHQKRRCCWNPDQGKDRQNPDSSALLCPASRVCLIRVVSSCIERGSTRAWSMRFHMLRIHRAWSGKGKAACPIAYSCVKRARLPLARTARVRRMRPEAVSPRSSLTGSPHLPLVPIDR